jgi:hypothetical protein
VNPTPLPQQFSPDLLLLTWQHHHQNCQEVLVHIPAIIKDCSTRMIAYHWILRLISFSQVEYLQELQIVQSPMVEMMQRLGFCQFLTRWSTLAVYQILLLEKKN